MLTSKVVQALWRSWPAAARADLCSSSWGAALLAQQACAGQQQQLQQWGLTPAAPFDGAGAGQATSRCFSSSSHARSSSDPQQQKQQQQQEEEAATSQHSSSSGEGHIPGAQGAAAQQEVKAAAKSMLVGKVDMQELWFSAVGGKLKVWAARGFPQLQGQEEEVVNNVKEAYYQTLQRAATGHLLSTRSRNQLKQACLAAATYKVLVESVPGIESEAEQLIADLMGGLYAPFMLNGLKFTTWVKKLLFRQSSISQAVDTLHNIAKDMEGACHCSVQPLGCGSDSELDDTAADAGAGADATQASPPAASAADSAAAAGEAASAAAAAAADTAANSSASGSASGKQQEQQWAEAEAEEHEKEDEAEAKAAEEAAAQHHSQQQWQAGAALTVDSCLYAQVLTGEGVPQLLRSFCCQHNMSWLETYSNQGVVSKLEACIAKGDSCCRIAVTPAE